MRPTVEQPDGVANPLVLAIKAAIVKKLEQLGVPTLKHHVLDVYVGDVHDVYLGNTFFQIYEWQAIFGQCDMVVTEDGWNIQYRLYYSDPDLFYKIGSGIFDAVTSGPGI